MKKRGITLILLAVTLCFAAQSFAQFTPEELAQRAKWEELLIKGKVVKKQDLGQGVTRPKRLFLKKDDFEGSGVWKQPTSTDAGLFDKSSSWNWGWSLQPWKGDGEVEKDRSNGSVISP